MHLGGKYKISWSNDDLERFYQSGHFEPPPGNLSRPRGPGQIGLSSFLVLSASLKGMSYLSHSPKLPKFSDFWPKIAILVIFVILSKSHTDTPWGLKIHQVIIRPKIIKAKQTFMKFVMYFSQ